MKQDVIVIGAGIIGLATAEYLLSQGATVTIFERNKAGGESSWAGGGILSPLCPWDYPDEITRLTNYSSMKYPDWISTLYQATGIDAELEISGMLVLPTFNYEIAQQWCSSHHVEIAQNTFIPPHTPTKEETSNIATQALLLPHVAQVRNPRLLLALEKRIIALGGKITEHCAAQEIKAASNCVQAVLTSRGIYHADQYIVTAGAWSKEVLGIHALNLDIRPVRGQILLFKFPSPPLRHILLQNDLYMIPRRDGHLLVGSTLEDVGFDKKITAAARDYLFLRAKKILPSLEDMPIIKQWSGLRPGSPQNIPTIGRHPDLKNLYINSGHFRYGVTMAPASAEILSKIILNAPQPFDTTAYQSGWQTANSPLARGKLPIRQRH